jgi:phage gp29-like protein
MATKKEQNTLKATSPTLAPRVVKKQISQTRRDIADWKNALLYAGATEPKNHFLQDIYNGIADDALLSSQINNRKEQIISASFELFDENGKIDERATKQLRSIPVLQDIFSMILDSEWYGYSLVELSVSNEGVPNVALINRRNVVPDTGRFYPDTSTNGFIEYRDTKEFGRYILEFNSNHIGLLNKTVPHILFKKFAQGCWSELCEIFGIPPRYIKTDTRDEQMLTRAESMMQEIGAAAFFIIDSTEEFQFAQGVNTNGDVYSNLISLCNNEISMLVSGAVIGQDTKNGNESKEKISVGLLGRLVDSDKRMVEVYMNSIIIPAFYRIGWLSPTTSKFRFSNVEDTDKLWSIVKDILPHKEVDNDFILERFGIKVTDKTANFQ